MRVLPIADLRKRGDRDLMSPVTPMDRVSHVTYHSPALNYGRL